MTSEVGLAEGLGAVFNSALASFERAADTCSTRAEAVRVGSRWLTVLAAGRAAANPIPDAISHLERGPAPATGLVVHVWDSASTGAPAPRLPPAGIYRSERDGVEIVVGDDPPQLEGTRRDGTAISWCADELDRPCFHHMRPFHRLLDEIATPPALVIHAAAVGDEHGVALLVGPSGTGKSTTSLLCHDAGMRVLADDRAILVPAAEGGVSTVESIYRSVKLRSESVARMPTPVRTSQIADDEHFLLLPAASMTRAGPLTAVVAVDLSRTRCGPRLVPIAPADRGGLLVSTAVPAVARRSAALRTWMTARRSIEGSVPAFRLELDWDHERVPALVDAARLGRATIGT